MRVVLLCRRDTRNTFFDMTVSDAIQLAQNAIEASPGSSDIERASALWVSAWVKGEER
jgi:hypothetical protein